MYTLLSIKTNIRFEISVPDLPSTHKMMSNLTAVQHKPETRKLATGATGLVSPFIRAGRYRL